MDKYFRDYPTTHQTYQPSPKLRHKIIRLDYEKQWMRHDKAAEFIETNRNRQLKPAVESPIPIARIPRKWCKELEEFESQELPPFAQFLSLLILNKDHPRRKELIALREKVWAEIRNRKGG